MFFCDSTPNATDGKKRNSRTRAYENPDNSEKPGWRKRERENLHVQHLFLSIVNDHLCSMDSDVGVL